MKIFLAPMEGLLDFTLRDILTALGGFDYCVTEFLRVTNLVYPDHMFFRYCPELRTGAKTSAGVPVYFQLLGGNPELLALNAQKAIKLGALGIDLNFGCPAKTVNRHDGGATLLQYPQRIYDIVYAVRQAVPKNIPVSAKIRLGYENKDLVIENSVAIEKAEASWLTVHARTKKEGYRPPAHWEYIAKIREKVNLPVIANGDIWNVKDYLRCREVTGCCDVMLGRGAIAMPDLALQIKTYLATKTFETHNWNKIFPALIKMFQSYKSVERNTEFSVSRLKQWCKQLGKTYPEAAVLFEKVKREKNSDNMQRLLLSFDSKGGV